MSSRCTRHLAKAIAQRLALAAASLAVSFLCAEAAWRLVLTSKTAIGQRLRIPTFYADPFTDDLFWQLRHRWQRGRYQPPNRPHPLLGWLSERVAADYSHFREDQVGDRRAVLLYGDSFAQGSSEVKHFQTIVNRTPEFGHGHYLLNYGVAGYGVDQIYLMYQQSVGRFDDPFVVFSLMTFDLDRSVLSVRIGQKPYFVVEDGRLELRGVPIDPRPEAYFAAHPPRVGSYVWRRLARLFWRADTDGSARERAEKQRINGAILDAAIADLEARDLDYVMLVFHARKAFREGPDWRSTWLRSLLEDRGVRYLWSYDILRREAGDRPLDDLFDPRDVHPTSLANRIIARAIAAEVLRAATPD